MRFGLPTIFWAILLAVAWSRQRHEELPREKLLVWGFGLGLFRELLLLTSSAIQILNPSTHDMLCTTVEPVEHTLALASAVVIAGLFLRYILDDALLARRYLQGGLGATALACLVILVWWPRQLAADPGIRFHATWLASLLHLISSALIVMAIFILVRKRGWLRNVVVVALSFLFLGEFLILLNLVTSQAYNRVLCPIGNSFHILAVPLFGLVYFREQSLELRTYREHLEELVAARTSELTSTNEQLQREIGERVQAEAEIAQRNAELAAQNAIAATISQSLDLDTILNATLDRALAVLEMEAGCIFLLDPDGESLTLKVYQDRTSSGERAKDERQQCLCQ